jgi:phosphatidylserine decarboxylase
MKIAIEGLKLIILCGLLALVFGLLGWWPVMSVFLVLGASLTFFFRDPRRTPPEGEHLLVSPADGKVLAVEPLESHPDLEGPATRVTIFLSLLDVHRVRSPLSAQVGRVEYHAGKFLPAYRPEAGSANESNTIVLKGGRTPLIMKQIVGVAARRIKCYVKEGDTVSRGEKVGLMYFGSRVEVYLPRAVAIKTGLNLKVRAGESVIAEVAS